MSSRLSSASECLARPCALHRAGDSLLARRRSARSCLSPCLARATPRGVARRRADSSRVGSSRDERCRAVPSAGVERSRTKASRWPRRARVALHRRSVCVRVRARLYSLRSPLLVASRIRASPPARTRAEHRIHIHPRRRRRRLQRPEAASSGSAGSASRRLPASFPRA